MGDQTPKTETKAVAKASLIGGRSLGLEIVKPDDLAITRVTAEEARELFLDNLAGQPLDTWKLRRYGVPGGGAMSWQPKLEGLEETKKLLGVVVAFKYIRSYYLEPFSGQNAPPDCSSADSINGFGIRKKEQKEPSACDCFGCPLAKFGSDIRPDGTQGRGQACGQSILVFLVEPEQILPTVVKLPPTSIKSWQAYTTMLTSAGVNVRRVLTEMTLMKDQNDDGIAYARLSIRPVGEIPPDQFAQAKPSLDALKTVVADNRELAKREASQP